MDWTAIFVLTGFLAFCFLAGTTGAVFKPGDWYDRLDKPSWNPPDWLFPIAWTVLYLMMAVAGWLVWREQGFGWPHVFWAAQLVLNAVWSVIFFGLRWLRVAIVEACLMWLAIFGCIVTFWPVSSTAALLMVPYLAWVSFAILLNWAIAVRNPGPHPLVTWAEMTGPTRREAARLAARAQHPAR